MINSKTRESIMNLRSKGYTYREICEEINIMIPKSTLSYICRNVTLPEGYVERKRRINVLKLGYARKKAIEANLIKNRIRLDVISQKAERVLTGESDNHIEKINLAILYKAEGSKYASYRGLSLGSSDPSILRMYIRLLQICYGKANESFRARVQYRADQNLGKLQEYWSDQLDIQMYAFYKSTPDKRSVGIKTKSTSYMGVCVISCSGADIQLELDKIAQLYSNRVWGVSSVG